MTTETTTPEQTIAPDNDLVAASAEASQAMAASLWDMQPTAYQNPQQQPPAQADAPPVNTAPAPDPAPEPDDIVDLDVYYQREFGMNHTDFRSKWEELNKPKEAAQEPQWANDDSRRLFDAFREGKEEDVYNYLNQKKQLERLSNYDVANADQAAEIIRANLQFKYKDLSSQEIDRLFSRQYSLPSQPQQALDQSDDDFAAATERWKQQVQEKQQDMIIDAKLAKPEIDKYKTQIVLPEIQKQQVQPSGPTQEELEAGRRAYLAAVESSYQNFKGYSVTAKDGDVQLPIGYNVSPEEQMASRQAIENFDLDAFFNKRWFDENNTPRVTTMQEDLYLLQNRDKIFQKIANESAAQLKAHFIKTQNNINLKGVNENFGPTPTGGEAPKNTSQILAESIWSM